MGCACTAALAVSLLSPWLLTLLYWWMLSSRTPREAWRRGRLLLWASLGVLAVLGFGIDGVDWGTVEVAVPLVLLAQLLMAGFFEKKSIGSTLYGVGGRSLRVNLVASDQPTAFAMAFTGKIYVTTGLYRLVTPEEAAAVIAHEAGHREALRPLPPAAVLTLLAVSAAELAEAVMNLASLCPGSAAAMILAGLTAWAFFNWAWEHLADIYSLRVTGLYAAQALFRITGARPEPPPRGPGRLLLEALRSLRPRRGPRGVGLLVNPHPPPRLRLWLLLRCSGLAPPAWDDGANP